MPESLPIVVRSCYRPVMLAGSERTASPTAAAAQSTVTVIVVKLSLPYDHRAMETRYPGWREW